MRFLSWIIGLPLAVVVVAFALSSREVVTLALWPLDEGLSLPAYLTVLAPLAIGLLLGLLAAGWHGLKYRQAARTQARRAASLERQLESLTAVSAPSPAPNPTEPPAAGNLPIPP